MAAIPDTTSRTAPPWRQKTSTFWRWWTGELSQMLPDRLARSSRVPVLAFEGGDIVLVEPRAVAGPESRVAAATLDAAAARTALRQLLTRAGETRMRARLRLGREAALVRRVTMPAATEENLSQVVAFEMDRLTPFRAEDVYFDQRVVSRDPNSAQVGVELALAQKAAVDALVARLRELGVSVQGVSIAEDSGSPPLDLLPSEQRGERESANERMLRNALLFAVGALFLVSLGYPVYQKREAVVAILPQIAKARQEAEATDVLVRSLERQVADYNFMQGKRHVPGALAFIEDLSRLLPDNTWVQQFDLRSAGKGREVQITGETVSSSRLIELLEQSTLLQNSAPRGTVTRGSQPGTERFMIAAEARSKPLPEAVPASEVALPAVPPPAPVATAAPPVPAAQATDPEGSLAAEGEPKADPAAAAAAAKAPPVPARLEPVARPRPPGPSPDARMQAEERARRLQESREKVEQRRKATEELRARRTQQPQPQPQPRNEPRR
jgi:general secretion pathway protein L